MNSGIYRITFRPTGEFYIGSSANLKQRRMRQRSKLKCTNQIFSLTKLQVRFRPFRDDDFVFEVVEFCDKSTLAEREVKWIKRLKPPLNISPYANGRAWGLRKSMLMRADVLKVPKRKRGPKPKDHKPGRPKR